MASGIDQWTIPTPFPVGGVNAYRVDGPRPALIDCGPRTPEAQKVLEEHLRHHPVRELVISHEHVDHAGLARTLQTQGVEVVVHRDDAGTLERWEEDAHEREQEYESGLVAAGVPVEHRERMRYGGRKYDQWSQSVRADRRIQGGDCIELGPGAFEVFDAPGHTPGSFLLSDGSTTFSGDTLLEAITPNALNVRRRERGALKGYLETLRRCKDEDWGVVYPGHGRPFTGAAQVIGRALRHAEVRQARILRELAAHAATAFAIVESLFPKIGPDQYFLATSEVLGHLGILEIEGRVVREAHDGVDHWQVATQA